MYVLGQSSSPVHCPGIPGAEAASPVETESKHLPPGRLTYVTHTETSGECKRSLSPGRVVKPKHLAPSGECKRSLSPGRIAKPIHLEPSGERKRSLSPGRVVKHVNLDPSAEYHRNKSTNQTQWNTPLEPPGELDRTREGTLLDLLQTRQVWAANQLRRKSISGPTGSDTASKSPSTSPCQMSVFVTSHCSDNDDDTRCDVNEEEFGTSPGGSVITIHRNTPAPSLYDVLYSYKNSTVV